MADPGFSTDQSPAPTTDSFTQAYQPVISQLQTKAAQLQDRYGKNASDISNIFGALTTVSAADKARINQQFTQSVQQQQDMLAQRTAQAQLDAQKGAAGAATAASETGSGGMPVPTSSLSGQATNQGIADSNAYATTWQGLQGIMQNQAVSNLDAAAQGYKFQQANAITQNARNLQDALSGNQMQQAQIQSDIAQAKLGAQAKGAEMGQESALAQAKNQTALDVARQQAAGRIGAAQVSAGTSRANAATSANAQITAAQIRAAAKNTPKAADMASPSAWEKAVRTTGKTLIPGLEVGGSLYRVKNSVSATLKNLQDAADKLAQSKKGDPTATGKVSASDVYKNWEAANKSLPANTKDLVWKAIQKGYYKTW
jgi:hypothetical protein